MGRVYCLGHEVAWVKFGERVHWFGHHVAGMRFGESSLSWSPSGRGEIWGEFTVLVTKRQGQVHCFGHQVAGVRFGERVHCLGHQVAGVRFGERAHQHRQPRLVCTVNSCDKLNFSI